ncbi:MAG TPA: hypothetical protein VHQ93_19655 [Chitinophagaceae bacterium]|jgi:hypothetical protein|nr:hypothetical protein [Chitinophagaceae bacterium]
MKNLFLFLLGSTLALTSAAQNPWELGGEYMMPIGKGYKSNIAGLRYENFNDKTSFSVGITYHFSPRDAYGGFKGYGLYAGFRNSFGNNTSGSNPFIGLRVLFAFENFEGKTNLGSLMFTPIGEAGYHFLFGDHFFTTPSIAYGYQIKVTKEHNTRDQDEGGRIIPGLAAGYRF